MENKIEKAMKKFEGKTVKVTMSGLIESKFYIKNLKYCIKDEILQIENDDDTYLDIDLDDVDNVYLEFISNEFVLLVLNLECGLQIKIQLNEDNVISIRDRILSFMEDNEVMSDLYREVCGAWWKKLLKSLVKDFQ